MLLFSVSLYANSCDDRVFDISGGQSSITPMEVLGSLASECSFAISVKDTKSQMILNTPSGPMSLKNIGFNELLDILIKERNLNYTFTGNLLKISYYVTETFKINYVGGVRYQNKGSQTSITVSNSGTETVGDGTSDAGSKGSTDSTIEYNDKYLEFFWEDIESQLNAIIFNDMSEVDTLANTTLESNSVTDYSEEDRVNREAVYRQSQQFHRKSRNVIINRAAGLITVRGTKEEVDRAREYIDKLENSLHASVMIDVSILKVTSSNSQTLGVDWNQLMNLQNVAVQYAVGGVINRGANSLGLADDVSYPNDTGDTTAGAGQPITSTVGSVGESTRNFGYSIFSSQVSLNRVVDFLKNYGDVSTISSPKVITLNNQPALISVGDIIRYESNVVYQTSDTGGTNTNTANTYPSVFAGILLDITPSIDEDEIILKINPSITGTKGIDVENASTALDRPPNLTSSQLSSIIRAKNGERIILGGLIKKDKSQQETKVPFFGDIPLIGYAFKQTSTSLKNEELVIVITPYIVGADEDNEISLGDMGYSLSQGVLDGNSTSNKVDSDEK
jgi:general secretion pathway protein D